jgi:hypothetical protein
VDQSLWKVVGLVGFVVYVLSLSGLKNGSSNHVEGAEGRIRPSRRKEKLAPRHNGIDEYERGWLIKVGSLDRYKAIRESNLSWICPRGGESHAAIPFLLE